MIITETNWRKLYDDAKGRSPRDTDYDLQHAIAWIAEHEEWGEYDDNGIKEVVAKVDQHMYDMTHDGHGNFLFGGGRFHIS